MSAVDDQYRPFAWAGLRLDVPEACRLFRIDGRYPRGDVGLADEAQPRVELAWRLIKRRRFDPQRMLRHQLVRLLPRDQRATAERHINPIDSEHFAPLLHHRDAQKRLDRCVGFARGSDRVVEMIVHFIDADRPDEALLRRAAATLRDQPPDQPQQWAFFGHRLTTPAGYLYDSATLNLGDMTIRLRHRDRRAHSLTIRLLYTARLALQRCGMPLWITAFHKQDKITGDNIYDLPGTVEGARCDTIDTPLGPGLVCESHLRRPIRLFRWKLPRRQHHWMIHDTKHDRLLYIRLADDPERLEPTLETILNGLDWQ
ncbi:MAG: hypothetical protein ACODAQ_04845 [Phycisphaeraceae bacterium]